MWHRTLPAVSGFLIVGLLAARAPAEPTSKPPGSGASDEQAEADETPEKKLFTGEVVNLQKALAERGVEASEEFADQYVLKTPDGELIPIVPDWRGRAFYQDERLRNRKVELVGYRREGLPYLQVLMVFTFDEDGQRMYTDYWCDVCSIPMYELKKCNCCRGPIRLRFTPRDLPDYVD